MATGLYSARTVLETCPGSVHGRWVASSCDGDLVGPVAPGFRGGVPAPADGRDGPRGAVLHAVVVDDDVIASEQHGSVRAEDDFRQRRPLGHDATPQFASTAEAVRASRSKQLKAPKRMLSADVGSSSTRAVQMPRTASCSCTASASTCSR